VGGSRTSHRSGAANQKALVPLFVPHTNFYEDVNFDGGRLRLDKNRGYWDLTEVSTGILGFGGHWNDKISSVELVATSVAVLHDDINMSGGTVTTGQVHWPISYGCADLGADRPHGRPRRLGKSTSDREERRCRSSRQYSVRSCRDAEKQHC
jgi:hypothetical protein